MSAVGQILKTVTHLDHFLHPLTVEKGTDKTSITKSAIGVLILGIAFRQYKKPAAIATAFYVCTAIWKYHYRSAQIQKQALSVLPPLMPKDLSEEQASKILSIFWQTHIRSIKVKHGTNSFYYRHFKTHGISHVYPQTLHDVVDKITAIWMKYRKRINYKSDKGIYFDWFVENFDRARKAQRITISFTGRQQVVDEFTIHERTGGEWVYAISPFIHAIQTRQDLLSTDERETVWKVDALRRLFRILPPMVVTLNGGADVPNRFWKGVWDKTADCFGPFERFRGFVKGNCREWQNLTSLKGYLDALSVEINKGKTSLSKLYELRVYFPIKPEELAVEVFPREQDLISGYPQLPISRPVKLRYKDCDRLAHYLRDGFCFLNEYHNSRFKLESSVEGGALVTRRIVNEQEDGDEWKEWQFKKQCTEDFMKLSGCEPLWNRYKAGKALFDPQKRPFILSKL